MIIHGKTYPGRTLRLEIVGEEAEAGEAAVRGAEGTLGREVGRGSARPSHASSWPTARPGQAQRKQCSTRMLFPEVAGECHRQPRRPVSLG